jgi:predicted nucleotidyltransferase
MEVKIGYGCEFNRHTNLISELSKKKVLSENTAMIDIEKIKPRIERVCQRLPVKRLGLFGSALSRNFSQDSDVDVLVTFDSDENIDLFDKYFELKEQLEKIFKRRVDLVVDKKFRNPVLRESIDRTRTVIYER